MFDLDLSNYNKMLENWKESNSKRLQAIKSTFNPNEFRFLFKELLLEVINFDTLWTELNSLIALNLKGYLKMSNSLRLTTPANFIIRKNKKEVPIKKALEIIESNVKILNQRKVKRKTNPNETLKEENITDYIRIIELFCSEANKSFVTFIQTCRFLENGVEKYKDLLMKFFIDLITDLENSISEIDKKLKSVPPPDLNHLYPLIQLYSELIYNWEANKNIGLLNDVQNYFNQMPTIINQGNLLKNFDLNFTDKNILYSGNISSFQEINEKFAGVNAKRGELHENIIKFGIVSDNAPKILKILDQMNPEFPVFLPRLAELVELEKQPTEEALNYVLAKTPDLGKYDTMAQVLMFTKPNEVGKLIDSLLKEYESSTMKE